MSKANQGSGKSIFSVSIEINCPSMEILDYLKRIDIGVTGIMSKIDEDTYRKVLEHFKVNTEQKHKVKMNKLLIKAREKIEKEKVRILRLQEKNNLSFNEFIELSLYKIYEDFKDEYKNQPLCDLQYSDLYMPYTSPKYEVPYVQQYYLLGHLPLYCFEYKLIFEELIKSSFLKINDFKILSIGSGAGLDFYGLYYAIINNVLEFDISEIYFGIDKVNWFYKNLLGLKLTPNIGININIKDIPDLNKYNVFIFPKSISEINSDVFENMMDVFNELHFQSEKLIIILSARSSSYYQEDIERIIMIGNILENKGYFTDEKYYPTKTLYSNNPNKFYTNTLEVELGDYYPFFIKNYLQNLENLCKEQNKKNCIDRCHEVLKKSPMNKTMHIAYNILKFKK